MTGLESDSARRIAEDHRKRSKARCQSGAPARALLICTPAGFERYFDRIAAQITGTEPPPEASKPIPESITLGPPIGEHEQS